MQRYDDTEDVAPAPLDTASAHDWPLIQRLNEPGRQCDDISALLPSHPLALSLIVPALLPTRILLVFRVVILASHRRCYNVRINYSE